MLKANKSAWFEKIFAVYNDNLLRRYFNSLNICGMDSIKKTNPTIIYANHSSWWDGLLAFQISRNIDSDSFVMMEEKHLRKLFLFRKLGAFSVVRENPRQAVKSLNYAINLLKEKPNRTLWIFPQGEILPNDTRPLKFYNGLSRIVDSLENCTVTSLAMRYEFLDEYKPDVFVNIRAPEIFTSDERLNSKILTESFESNLTKTLDRLKQDVATKNTTHYEKIF